MIERVWHKVKKILLENKYYEKFSAIKKRVVNFVYRFISRGIMRIHALQHIAFEDLAGIAEWAYLKNHSVSYTRFHQGESAKIPMNFDLLVILGGPMGARDEAKYPWMRDEKLLIEKAISEDKLVLGICLGAQLVADVLGALVYKNNEKEIGIHPITLTEEGEQSPFLKGFKKTNEVFQWHGDTFEIPMGCKKLATSIACENQAFSCGDKVLALQFHVESTFESMEKLINNCGVELTETKFIQKADTMRKKMRESHRELQRLLTCLMNNITAFI